MKVSFFVRMYCTGINAQMISIYNIWPDTGIWHWNFRGGQKYEWRRGLEMGQCEKVEFPVGKRTLIAMQGTKGLLTFLIFHVFVGENRFEGRSCGGRYLYHHHYRLLWKMWNAGRLLSGRRRRVPNDQSIFYLFGKTRKIRQFRN